MSNSLLGALGGAAAAGMAQGSTLATTGLGHQNYPGQRIYTNPPTPQALWPYDHRSDAVGLCRVRKLENGYVVEFVAPNAPGYKEYYCEDLKAVGERITATLVQRALEGDGAK